jgi:methionyl-tRNA synthetase
MINIDDFAKIEIKVGIVTEASDVENSNKLIRLTVEVGEEKPRTIFTAVRTYGFTIGDFTGKKFLFATNLEPKKIMGEESQGMILAVDSDSKPVFISAEGLPVGAKVR